MKFHVQNRWAKLGEKVGELGKYDQRTRPPPQILGADTPLSKFREKFFEAQFQILCDAVCECGLGILPPNPRSSREFPPKFGGSPAPLAERVKTVFKPPRSVPIWLSR